MIDFGLVPAIALAFGLSWASGINVYAVLMMLGLGSITGLIDLPSSLDFTTYPLVLVLSIMLFVVEFIVDKIPYADTAWDGPHTFIRIILGGFLASKVVGEIDPSLIVVGAIVGSFIAGSSHTMKSGTRVVVNTSPEPFSNVALSLIEDLLVLGGIFLAIKYPLFFLVLFGAYVLLAIWLLPKIWRGAKNVFGFFKKFFGAKEDEYRFDTSNETPPPKRDEALDTKGTLLDAPNSHPKLLN